MPKVFTFASKRGGILIFTLIMLGMFMTIMIASVGLIGRQFNRLVVGEQEEQAFQSAEAGVHYALWLLGNDLVDLDDPQPVSDFEITDDTLDPPETIGIFDITFEIDKPEGLDFPLSASVTSVGQDPVLLGQQATVTASVYSPDGNTYVITNWHRQP